MIEWMQKHKKWLVVTIWISTIAFIAAGMVGWGSLNFSLDQGVVAKVGDVKVTQRQFDNQFRQIFAQYNSDGGLDLQKAKELGLEKLALDLVIQRALLQNFANEMGIYVSEKEVQSEIAKLEFFQEKDLLGQSKFSLKLYQDLLKQNNIAPSDFEQDIKDDLLIKKALTLLPPLQITNLEEETFLFPFQIQDELKIKILSLSQIHPKPTKEEIESFWKDNQEQFTYPAEYKIEYLIVPEEDQKPTQEDLQKLYEDTKSQFLDENGNIKPFKEVLEELKEQKKSEMAEEKALLEYVKLKESKELYGLVDTLIEGEKKLGLEVQEAIEGANVGDTINPIKTAEGYVVVKLIEKKPQSKKTYEDAKEEAKELLVQKLKQEQLIALAKESVAQGFRGESIGYVDLMQFKSIKGLDSQESMALTSRVLSSQTPRGYVLLGEKAVVFEVIKQKLKESISQEVSANSRQLVEMFKDSMIRKDFFKYLENKYKIIQLKTL
ncbi:peptidylprolyl isomerase [Helicobacter brantae]|uniref:Periplasmic chaperone PpiD n=1 Tax=Helicobacter brantae TaxID=375927 RepID=A0A3D8J1M1_9HELI|nr:peptidylprolyl isomerase [Helicobacter brantae]RDU71130.1 hypothetical protein CQA58_03180 [Helicobacter brantae]